MSRLIACPVGRPQSVEANQASNRPKEEALKMGRVLMFAKSAYVMSRDVGDGSWWLGKSAEDFSSQGGVLTVCPLDHLQSLS